MEALISFLPTPADGAIGALDWTSKERKRLAKQSVNYHCPTCGCKAIDLLPELKPKDEKDSTAKPSKFQKEIEKLHQWQGLEHKSSSNVGEEKTEEEKEGKEKETAAAVAEEEAVVASPSSADEKAKAGVSDNQQNTEEPPKNEPPARLQFAPAPAPSGTPLRPEQQEEQPLAVEEEEQSKPPENEPVPIQEAQLDMPPAPPQTRVEEEYSSWMSDPLLHGIIVILAIICFLLMRRLQALMEELNSLGSALE